MRSSAMFFSLCCLPWILLFLNSYIFPIKNNRIYCRGFFHFIFLHLHHCLCFFFSWSLKKTFYLILLVFFPLPSILTLHYWHLIYPNSIITRDCLLSSWRQQIKIPLCESTFRNTACFTEIKESFLNATSFIELKVLLLSRYCVVASAEILFYWFINVLNRGLTVLFFFFSFFDDLTFLKEKITRILRESFFFNFLTY